MLRAPAPYYLSLLLLAACPKSAPPDCPPTVLLIGLVPFGARYTGSEGEIVTGVEYRACNPDALDFEATAAMVDPDNQLEPSTTTVRVEKVNATDLDSLTPIKVTLGVDAGSDADTRLAFATVHFTLATPGVHHLSVQFEPNLGSVQTDVELMLDRRDAGFVTLAMPAPCDDFDVSLGVPLCLSGGQLHSVRDGGVLSSLTAKAFAADGEDVWTVTENGLALSRLDPSGVFTPLATVTLTGALPSSTPAVYASGERAFLAWPPLFLEAWLDGGVQLGPVQTTPQNGPYAIHWRPGVGALVGSDGHDGVSLCSLLFADGGTRCQSLTVVGADGDAVWTQELNGSLTAFSMEADGGLASRTGLIGGGILFGDSLVGSRLTGPMFRGATLGLLLAELDAGLPVVAYSEPSGLLPAASLGVSAKRFWECSVGGTLDYVER